MSCSAMTAWVLWAAVCGADDAAPAETDGLTPEEREVVRLTNEQRRAAGLEPLAISPKLNQAAAAHSRHMAGLGKLAHELSGTTPAERVRGAGYEYRLVGENVAWNQPDAEAVVKAWMGSDYHRANILRPEFTEIGVAVARNDKGEPYWTQVFARPQSTEGE